MDVFTRILVWIDAQRGNNDVYYFIAITILKRHKDIIHMGIEELASICFTSPATISRFCRKLHFDNFISFKEELQIYQHYFEEEVQIDFSDYSSDQSIGQIITDKTISISVDAILETYRFMDMHIIESITYLLSKAEHVALFGHNYSQLVARDCQYKFVRLGKFATAYSSDENQERDIEDLKKEDVAIFFSVSGENRKFIDFCYQLKKKHVPIILITSNQNSVMRDFCKYVFMIGGTESTFTLSSISGRIAMMSIVDVLYTNLALALQVKKYNKKEI